MLETNELLEKKLYADFKYQQLGKCRAMSEQLYLIM